MKKITLLLILFCPLFHLLGQNITGYEYWFDYQSTERTQITTTDRNISLTLDVSGLSEGIHFYNFRAKDTKGSWSSPLTQYFYRTKMNPVDNKIVQYEYWIDKNYTNRTNENSTNGIVNLNLDVNSLCEGIHFYNFRAKDTNGNWSSPVTQYFYRTKMNLVNNKITQYEYWIDKNYANRTTENSTNSIVNLNLDVNSLCEGIHHFNFRTKDTKGTWSSPVTQYFYRTKMNPVDNKITQYEYWWNDAINLKTIVNIEPINPAEFKDMIFELGNIPVKCTPQSFVFMPDILGGKALIYYSSKNFFNIRFKDTYNNWSIISSNEFEEGRSIEISAEEIFENNPVTKNKPAADEIHFYKLNALSGNNLFWKTDVPCIVQVFDEVGNEVCKLTPENSLSGASFQTNQNSTYYVMLHSVESREQTVTLSYKVENTANAIELIKSDNILIQAIKGEICITTQGQSVLVSIFNISGQKIYNSEINGNENINLPAGIYIIKINNKTMKIIVK